MKKELQSFISHEDPNHPFTDTEISKKFMITREYVTILRKELHIPDSRERKKNYITAKIQEIYRLRPSIALRELKDALVHNHYDISEYLLNKYLDDLKFVSSNPSSGDVVEPTSLDERCDSSAFENLIGTHGSLSAQIQQAKAAVLYPPHGLHCLIVGETGVGKSELAESMYRFALAFGSLPPGAPFNVFNCADYAENPQLLITQLFGCAKGAYTGADTNRRGLIEQTDGGILFLDEVHRLSSEGQEMLFQLIDKGHFRRLGEADAVREAHVQFLAATTENIDTSLLATFKRRIPMLIALPALAERPLGERLELIRKFFGDEARRMNAPLKVSMDAMRACILYDCAGNIGQLKSDIQVACAKSFLDFVTKKEENVWVDVQHLPTHVKQGLLKLASRRNQLAALIWKDAHFEPEGGQDPAAFNEDVYSFPKEFYGYIEQLYASYEKRGLASETINTLVGEEIEERMRNVVAHIQRRMPPLTLDEAAKVIGHDVIVLAQDVLQLAEKELGIFPQSLIYCLAVHLGAVFTRLEQGKKIINPNLQDIRFRFAQEYTVACKMAVVIENRCHMVLPEDEIGYIALYLHKPEDMEEEGRVGIVVAAHGGVGSAILDVAAKLLNVTHGRFFNMSFEQDPQDGFEALCTLIQEADEGKGVLMLVDMGSLLTFGDLIQAKTKVQVETVERVDTIMVMEALRRSILPGMTLQTFVENIEELNETFPKARLRVETHRQKPRALLTTCFTGEGAAVYCLQRLKKLFGSRLNNISLLHTGLLDESDFHQQIYGFMERYEILAVVGSVDPKLLDIPYISMGELMTQEGEKRLSGILETGPSGDHRGICAYRPVPATVQEMLVLLFDGPMTKQELLHKMCMYLEEKGYVDSGYEKAVFEREDMGTFLINNKVALPHADSTHVKRSVILFVKVFHSVEWEKKQPANLVCMLGLDVDGKESVQYLYNRFLEEEVISLLEAATTEDEIREAVVHNGNNNK